MTSIAVRLIAWVFIPTGITLVWWNRELAEWLVSAKRTVGPLWLNQGACIAAGLLCVAVALEVIFTP